MSTDRPSDPTSAVATPPERRPHFTMTWDGPRGSTTLNVYDPDVRLVCLGTGCAAFTTRDPVRFSALVRAVFGDTPRTETSQ